ncbi:MAG: hypothetical protein KHY06_11230, partial [Escherichia coli]|nr:hypothetical protein [Escherichia coli]
TVEDIRNFGMIPEFLGRLPIVFTLQGMNEDMLIKILKEPKNAILKQYQKLLALDEVKQGSMPEDQKKAMVQGITQNNAQIVFEALMSNLRKEAKIKIGDALEQQ